MLPRTAKTSWWLSAKDKKTTPNLNSCAHLQKTIFISWRTSRPIPTSSRCKVKSSLNWRNIYKIKNRSSTNANRSMTIIFKSNSRLKAKGKINPSNRSRVILIGMILNLFRPLFLIIRRIIRIRVSSSIKYRIIFLPCLNLWRKKSSQNRKKDRFCSNVTHADRIFLPLRWTNILKPASPSKEKTRTMRCSPTLAKMST